MLPFFWVNRWQDDFSACGLVVLRVLVHTHHQIEEKFLKVLKDANLWDTNALPVAQASYLSFDTMPCHFSVSLKPCAYTEYHVVSTHVPCLHSCIEPNHMYFLVSDVLL